MTKKILIIGSGFNALASAYLLINKNHNVQIVSERGVKGVLSSIKIENQYCDLGFQFFDGLDEETDLFIRKMFSNEDLYDFKYGASTLSNNFLYEDHAIPFWMSYGKLFVLKAFVFYLKELFLSFFYKRKKNFKNLSELYKDLPPNIRDFLSRGCQKNYQINPKELDPLANEMSTITNFRQTLFNDKLSNFLKNRSTFFDEHLASRRKSNSSLKEISLYPRGKNMEFIVNKLISKLKKKGVIFENYNFDNINLISGSNFVEFNDEKFNNVLITTNLSNIQRIFKLNMDKSFEHYVSQIFIYFTLDKIDFKFQYLQINDLNLYCSRISNYSLYSNFSADNNHVLIAEIPLSPLNKLWENDDELIRFAWNEIRKSGILRERMQFNYKTAKVLKIKKTFPIPKVNFFENLYKIQLNLEKKFSGNVKMIGQGIFTRHKFVKELLRNYKL